jgi:hypothetical protein
MTISWMRVGLRPARRIRKASERNRCASAPHVSARTIGSSKSVLIRTSEIA